MRRLALVLLSSSTLGLALGQAASAADMPVKYRPPPPVVAPYSWTGFYVGAHLGAGWARKQWTDTGNCSSDGFKFGLACSKHDDENVRRYVGSHNAIGVLGGIQGGFNIQTGIWVWGIEGQYSWSDLQGDHQDSITRSKSWNRVWGCFESGDTCRFATGFVDSAQQTRMFQKIKGIGTIAGRLGLTGWPNDSVMFFVKAGGAYMKESLAATLSGSLAGQATRGEFTCCDPSEVDISRIRSFSKSFNAALSGDKTRWGYVVGIGSEFRLYGNATGVINYEYLDFGQYDVTLTGTACTLSGSGSSRCGPLSKTFNIDTSIHVIKLGVNWRFDWGKTPVAVAAKY